MKSTTVNARMDPRIKREADEILGQLDISTSTLISALYRQIVYTKGIPFPITVPHEPPSLNCISSAELHARLYHSYEQSVLSGDGERPGEDLCRSDQFFSELGVLGRMEQHFLTYPKSRYEILMTPDARKDVRRIMDYISEDLSAPAEARAWADMLRQTVYTLFQMPMRYAVGRQEPLSFLEIRKVRKEEHCVFFHVDRRKRQVFILMVLCGSRSVFDRYAGQKR